MALKPMFDQYFSSFDELQELEDYNRVFNERMAKRPITNKITCAQCNGCGKIGTVFDWHPPKKCLKCEGTGYVTLTT